MSIQTSKTQSGSKCGYLCHPFEEISVSAHPNVNTENRVYEYLQPGGSFFPKGLYMSMRKVKVHRKKDTFFLQPQPFEASAIKFSSNVATEIVTHTDNNLANPFKYSKSHDGKCFEPVAAAERKK